MQIRTLGLITETPESEVDYAIADGFRSLGIEVIPLNAQKTWRADLDAYLISGPFYPLSHILSKIENLASHRPPRVIVWLTEQRASSDLPRWYIRTIGTGLRIAAVTAESLLRSKTGQAVKHRIDHFLATGIRYRLPCEIKWLHDRGYLSLLAVLTPSHKRFYQDMMGVPAEVIPYGYHVSFGRDLKLNRDIDVVFLGSLRDHRRSEIMKQYERDFAAMGIRFTIHDGSPERGLVFGDERTQLLNRAKILLSIMRQPWDDPVFRVLLATPNGAMVVSEPVQDDYPFKPGVHLVVAEIEKIPETVKYYLDHETERRQIVQNASNTICNSMTSGQMAEKILAALNQRAEGK